MKFKLVILLLFAVVALPLAYPFFSKDNPPPGISDPTPEQTITTGPEDLAVEPQMAPVNAVPIETNPVPPAVRDPGERLLVFGQLPENFLPRRPASELIVEAKPLPTLAEAQTVTDFYSPPEVRNPGSRLLVFGQLPENFLPRRADPVLVVDAKSLPTLAEAQTVTDFYSPPEVRDPGSRLLVFGQLPERFLPRRADPVLVVETKPMPTLSDPVLMAEAQPELFEPEPEIPLPNVQPPNGQQVINDIPGQVDGGPEFTPLRVLFPNQQPEALQRPLKIFTMPVVVSLLEENFTNRYHPFDIGKKTGRLAYAPEIEGQGVVVIEDPRNGQTIPVSRPGGSAGMPVWSPDENFLAYSSEQAGRSAIYIQDMTTGGSRRVVGLPHFAKEPAWSPDGLQLAFSSRAEGSWDIWIITLADGSLRQITSNSGNEHSPKWSPDGSMLAFHADWDGGLNIWLAAVEGGDLLQLTEGDYDNYRPAWGPEGRDIAFISKQTGNTEIWSLDLETRALTQITNAGMEIDYPIFGPGGNEIHFINHFKAAYLRSLTDTFQGWSWAELPWWQTAPWLNGVEDAALSPDGSVMVFRRQVDGIWQLFFYFYDRRETRQITFTNGNTSAPAWLADGSGFIYNRADKETGLAQLVRYGLVGSRETILHEQTGANFSTLCGTDLYFLAPNANIPGRTALWHKNIAGDGPAERLTDTILSPEKISCAPGGAGVYVVNLQTGLREINQFNPFDGLLTPIPIGPWTAERPIENFDPSNDFNPVLSPDGTKVAFLSNRDGNDGIYLKYLDTNEVRRLTYTGEQESGLFWSPDSKSIFTTSYLEEYTFQKVRIIDVFSIDFTGPV